MAKAKKMVTLIAVDGTLTTLDDDGLEAMQAAVGGLVQPVPIESGGTLLVNEEGLLLNMPVNFPASLLAGQTIVGPAVLLKNSRNW